jgi:murein L,D-transpeptidase YcbB/YkuD
MQRAMQADEPTIVHLSRTIPVVIFYTTVVASSDGVVRFLPDVYGHDVRLERALRAAQASAMPANASEAR